MGRYYAESLTATATWQEKVIVSEPDNAFSSLAISNDDSNPIQIKINDLSNDAITINTSEGIELNIEIYKLFYYSASGSAGFRVICDG
jgi:hypothetical protein